MRLPMAVGVGVVVLALLLEVVAVPLASRAVGSALARCVPYGSLAVEGVSRPVLPRLLVGRARDVVVRVEDVEVQGLRVAEAVLEAPHVVLPWALGSPRPSAATVHLRVDQAAVADRLGDLTPLGIRPDVDLEGGVARVGIPGTRLEATLSLVVRDDGVLVLRPGSTTAGWWDRLGLSRQITLPDDVQVREVAMGDEALTATLTLDGFPAADGEGCDAPVAGERPEGD